MKRWFVILNLFSLCMAMGLRAQEPDAETEDGRVQYALILPDEKTPEIVKAEENNPFEAMADVGADKDGSTEENQVRDLLLTMSVGGTVSGAHGTRVMLGSMRLESGMEVPPVIPDQQVSLRVKAITPTAIELVWVEKKPTGLPPKLLVIPLDGAPKIRYRMPAGGGVGGQRGAGSMGTIRGADVSMYATPPAPPEQQTIVKAERVEEAAPKSKPAPAEAPPATKPSAPPSNTPEASVLRMLFGNRPPEAK